MKKIQAIVVYEFQKHVCISQMCQSTYIHAKFEVLSFQEWVSSGISNRHLSFVNCSNSGVYFNKKT